MVIVVDITLSVYIPINFANSCVGSWSVATKQTILYYIYIDYKAVTLRLCAGSTAGGSNILCLFDITACIAFSSFSLGQEQISFAYDWSHEESDW